MFRSVRAVKVFSNCTHVVLLVSMGFWHKEKSARCVKASRSSLIVTSLPFLVMFTRAELYWCAGTPNENEQRLSLHCTMQAAPTHVGLAKKHECRFGGENFFLVGLRAIRLTPKAHAGCWDCIRHLFTVHWTNYRSWVRYVVFMNYVPVIIMLFVLSRSAYCSSVLLNEKEGIVKFLLESATLDDVCWDNLLKKLIMTNWSHLIVC